MRAVLLTVHLCWAVQVSFVNQLYILTVFASLIPDPGTLMRYRNLVPELADVQ